MSNYVQRAGQVIGPWLVVADAGRTARGKVLWRILNTETGRIQHMRTDQVIKLARQYGVPQPEAKAA